MLPDKTCSTCRMDMPSDAFHASASRCKGCAASYAKQYRQTSAGLATIWFTDIKKRAGNRNGRNPSYTLIEMRIDRDAFITWATYAIDIFRSQHPHDTPSLDRINPDGHYELGNIRVISWKENSRLARRKEARRVKGRQGLPWRPGIHDSHTPLSHAYETSYKQNRPAPARAAYKNGDTSNIMNKSVFNSHMDFPSA